LAMMMMMMEAVRTSGTSVYICETTWHHTSQKAVIFIAILSQDWFVPQSLLCLSHPYIVATFKHHNIFHSFSLPFGLWSSGLCSHTFESDKDFYRLKKKDVLFVSDTP
jgi:hypothetical protein